MKGTPKPKRKTAKTWPKTNQNTPIKQQRWYAGPSGAELCHLIRQNINNTLRQHRQYASLSKVESRHLIGRKTNKGNSCASVSQKRKHMHAVKCGRHYQKVKPLRKCNKLQKPEVSHTYETPVRPHILRHRNIKSPGHGISPNRAPYKKGQESVAPVGQAPQTTTPERP